MFAALASGAAGYLNKNAEPRALYDTIRQVAGGEPPGPAH
jgi:DNA-binding NarL/FixJ family response regulator